MIRCLVHGLASLQYLHHLRFRYRFTTFTMPLFPYLEIQLIATGAIFSHIANKLIHIYRIALFQLRFCQAIIYIIHSIIPDHNYRGCTIN